MFPSFVSHRLFNILAGVALLSSGAHGAVISWQTAQDTTGITNISTTGALLYAYNEGGGAITVNGVPFTAANHLGGNAVGLLAAAGTGNSSLDTLLDSVSYGGGTSTSIDLGSFIVGKTYQIQVFYTDQRPGSTTRALTLGSSTGGSTVNVKADSNSATTSPYGQYVIGTWTADGTDPDLTIVTQGFANAHVTALQVRDITVPEPSVMLSAAVALAILPFRRNRN